MRLRDVLLAAMAVLVLAAVAQAMWWWPLLPDRVASHFDISSRPNGWMGATGFVTMTVVLHVFMAGLFLGLPLLLGRIPSAHINMPNKEYWLAPPRRDESLAAMTAGLLVIGCATMVFMLVIFHGVFALNAGIAEGGVAPNGRAVDQDQPLVLPLPVPFPALIGLYMAAIAAVLVWMLRRFRKPV